MTAAAISQGSRGAARLSHVDAQGRARMVDVGDKPVTERDAVAARRRAHAAADAAPDPRRQDRQGRGARGGARRRHHGRQAHRRADSLCHPLPIQVAAIDFTVTRARHACEIEARVKVTGKTGVEMEALTAVSVAALTVYDMCKAVDRGMVISDIRLMEKRGGRSGEYRRRE